MCIACCYTQNWHNVPGREKLLNKLKHVNNNYTEFVFVVVALLKVSVCVFSYWIYYSNSIVLYACEYR